MRNGAVIDLPAEGPAVPLAFHTRAHGGILTGSQPAFGGIAMTIRIILGSALGIAACLTSPAHAQWSDDPAQNLVVADRPGGQVQPKLVATADGGFYVSWFDAGSGYDVYLQRLAADGTEQWTHNGVLAADRAYSSTEDYGLDVDAAGNALLAYRFEVGGVTQAAANRIAPDGTPLWGANGVVVSDDAGDVHSPSVAATSDGGTVVAWSASDGSIGLQKLDGDGNPLWSDGVFVTPPSGFFLMADLHAADDGSVIASWAAWLSTQNRQYWTQKFAGADGAPLWGAEPVKVFDGNGGAMQFGYTPDFVPDGDGGAVFVWYTVGTAGTARAQHVLANGSAAFAQNGTVLGTDAALTHTSPIGAYDPASGDVYAIWHVADALTQSQIGVNAQRVDATGARQWGDDGKVLVAQSATEQSQLGVLAPADGGALFSWASDSWPQPMPVQVARLDAAGDYVWASQTVAIKTGATDTARMAGAMSMQPFAAWVWQDDADGGAGGSIKAQNIDFDGNLGAPAAVDLIFADGFDG